MLVIERMTARSSTHSPTWGNMLLTGMPLSPYSLKGNGDAKMLPFSLNWVRSIFVGIGLP